MPVVSRRGEASLWEVEAGDYHIYPYSLIIYREAQAKVAERSVKRSLKGLQNLNLRQELTLKTKLYLTNGQMEIR